MNRTYKKVFSHNPELLEELFKLRYEGWSYPRLARRFKIDHSSIIYQCQKAGILPKEKVKWERPLCKVCGRVVATFYNKYCSRKCMMKRNKIEIQTEIQAEIQPKGENNEKINKGVDYATYLEREYLKKSKVDTRLRTTPFSWSEKKEVQISRR